MKSITYFFKNTAEFIKYVPGISANLELNELNSSAISARKQIRNIIDAQLWDKIEAELDTEAKFYLSNAFGNLIMYKALVFDIVSKRMSGGTEVYKHELEAMRRQYIDNYYNAMDSLIEELTTNDAYSTLWQNTSQYKMISELKIQKTVEFHSLYGIDMSYLFFFRTIPLQREILLDGLNNLFTEVESKADLTNKLKLALAQLVIALALSRFDIIELPTSIRNLFDEQKTGRSGVDEQNRVLKLASELRSYATAIISAVELSTSEPESGNVDPDTIFNQKEDKIYLIS